MNISKKSTLPQPSEVLINVLNNHQNSAILLYCCPDFLSCPANVISMGWENTARKRKRSSTNEILKMCSTTTKKNITFNCTCNEREHGVIISISLTYQDKTSIYCKHTYNFLHLCGYFPCSRKTYVRRMRFPATGSIVPLKQKWDKSLYSRMELIPLFSFKGKLCKKHNM